MPAEFIKILISMQINAILKKKTLQKEKLLKKFWMQISSLELKLNTLKRVTFLS